MKGKREKEIRNLIVRNVFIFILILAVIVALGCSIGLHTFTIIEWWKPASICAMLALPATFLLARCMSRLTRQVLPYLEYPAAFILSFSILLVSFYAANYFLSDRSSCQEYMAPVVDKYSQQRTRSHKVGRRGYREEKYTVYMVEIEMPDGKIKKLEKPLSEYNRIKKGGTMKLFIEDGLFSIPVIHRRRQND